MASVQIDSAERAICGKQGGYPQLLRLYRIDDGSAVRICIAPFITDTPNVCTSGRTG